MVRICVKISGCCFGANGCDVIIISLIVYDKTGFIELC